MEDKKRQEKQKGFRFSKRTIDNLRAMIDDLGVVRNETEAVDLALEHMVTELKTQRSMEAAKPGRFCRFETMSPQAFGMINCV